MKMQNQKLAEILYHRECPFAYKCLAVNCVDCAELHIEGKTTEEQIEKKEE